MTHEINRDDFAMRHPVSPMAVSLPIGCPKRQPQLTAATLSLNSHHVTIAQFTQVGEKPSKQTGFNPGGLDSYKQKHLGFDLSRSGIDKLQWVVIKTKAFYRRNPLNRSRMPS